MIGNTRLAWSIVAIVALLGAAVAWRLVPVLRQQVEELGDPAAPAGAMVGNAVPEASVSVPARPDRPSFDIVRISPEGTGVIAGRALPGSDVSVMANGTAVGQTVSAGVDGSWALILADPLPPGATEFTLVATLPDGRTVESETVLLVDVPQRGSGGEALAILTPRAGGTGTPVILQGPSDTAALSVEDGPVLESVDYGGDGAVRLSGRGRPGTTVRLYLDDRALGDTVVGASGRWRFQPSSDIPAGRYRLRLDEVGADGRVVARREVPFERAPADAVLAADDTRFVVQPGNSLWRIAEQRFGSGFRYVDIYRANRAKIGDPDLIYPGQIFDLPE